MGRDSYSNRRLVEHSSKISMKFVYELIKQNYPDQEIRAVLDQVIDNKILFKYNEDRSLFEFIKQPCNYGNDRYYFKCPYCEEKFYKLYKPKNEAVYACRKCHDLTYRQQKTHDKRFDFIVPRPKLELMERLLYSRRKKDRLRAIRFWKKDASTYATREKLQNKYFSNLFAEIDQLNAS